MRKIIIDNIAKRKFKNLEQELKKEYKQKNIKFINNIYNLYFYKVISNNYTIY